MIPRERERERARLLFLELIRYHYIDKIFYSRKFTIYFEMLREIALGIVQALYEARLTPRV